VSEPEVCEVSIGKVPCTEPASEAWWIGCVHEHVNRVPICEEHARRLRADWDCVECDREGTPAIAAVERREPITSQEGDHGSE
jgi:hypothetical protein